MNTLENKFDLSLMKENFEKHISDVRLISDLTLSESDFKRLGAILKYCISMKENKRDIEEVMICYLVYWVFSLNYWDEEIGIHDELTEYCSQLPQHMIRHHFQMLTDAFADYGINDFGYTADNIEERCFMIMARHAGIPDDEKCKVFDLIDDYRNHNASVDVIVDDIYSHLPFKSRYIFSLLDKRSRQDVIWEIRNIMTEISLTTCTRDELLEKYPQTSIRLIDYCYHWKDGINLLELAE